VLTLPPHVTSMLYCKAPFSVIHYVFLFHAQVQVAELEIWKSKEFCPGLKTLISVIPFYIQLQYR
jgi:hypothetical protein